MIIDFPEAKKEMNKRWTQFFKEQTEKSSPFSQQSKAMRIWEGNRFGVVYDDGTHTVNEIKLFEVGFSIPRQRIENISDAEFIGKMTDAADEMGRQMDDEMFSVLNESVKGRNNIDVAPNGLTPDVLLLSLQKMFITFENDDRTKPNMPSIVTGEKVIKKLKEIDANETEEQKKAYREKLEKILDEKYEEYLNDLNSRKITD